MPSKPFQPDSSKPITDGETRRVRMMLDKIEWKINELNTLVNYFRKAYQDED